MFTRPMFDRARIFLRSALSAIVFALLVARTSSAAISSSGSVSPSPPTQAGADPVIGINDIGRLNITAPSIVTSDFAIIGQQLTGIGYAILSGFDAGTASAATWTTNDIVVGNSGTGSLEILNGAIVTIDFLANPSTGDLSVGNMPDSVGRVVVSGRGSLLRIGNDTFIGHNPSGPSGTGTLIIADEGFVIGTNDAATGQDIFSVGVRGCVELAGGRLRTEFLSNQGTIVGSGRIDNEMTISNGVTGRFEVRAGDRMVVNGGASGGIGFDNDGEVAAIGGEIAFLEQFTNTDQAAAVTLRNGTVHFPATGFGFDSTSGVLASTGGVNDIYGTVRIQGASSRIVVAGESTAVFHDPVTNSGATIEVFPGSSALYLQGLATTGSSAALSVHLADPAMQPGFGAVEVATSAALDGTLEVQLANGFVPAIGHSFQVLTAAGGITGSLSLATVPTLPTGLQWDLDVNATNVVLSVVSTGDYNANGVVDAADFVVWRNALGETGAGLAADGDGNGIVDSADYDYWRGRFGNAAVAGAGRAASAVIPEPASALIVCIAAAAIPLNRKRKLHYIIMFQFGHS